MMDERQILDNLTKRKQIYAVANVDQPSGGMYYDQHYGYGHSRRQNPIIYKPLSYHTHRYPSSYRYSSPLGYGYSRLPSYYNSYRSPLSYSYIGNSLD